MADGALVSAPRIAVVLPSRETFLRAKSGAVALCARDFARFSRYGVDVFGAGPCDYADVSYRRLEGWRRWWRRDRDAYAEAVAQAARDHALIEVQNRPHMIAALRRRLPGARLALHLHNDPQEMQGSKTPAERARLLALCDGIYAVSAFVRGRFLEGVRDDEGKVVTVWNGVELPPPAAKERIVAFTGRIIAAKGAQELARAFEAAAPPGWRLVLAGGGAEGRASSGAVEWRGQVSHAQAMALLGSAEIAAVPSLWEEPFGRAAVEAMACGAALIASRRGALREVCGEAALYVEPEDIADFAAGLRRLVEDEALRRRLQDAARARAAELFEIGAATARLDEARAALFARGGRDTR
jgi:glycosyltransferase involved in cell wall biosynthesis